jgi:hypothetical protein
MIWHTSASIRMWCVLWRVTGRSQGACHTAQIQFTKIERRTIKGWKESRTCYVNEGRVRRRESVSTSKANMWSWHRGQGIFLQAYTTALGPTQPPVQWVLLESLTAVKRPGPEPDHLPPLSADVENDWCYKSIPLMLSWGAQRKLCICIYSSWVLSDRVEYVEDFANWNGRRV